ncbi:MAG: Gfo/Idh/MocA family oxidoreductase, partial [Verrucomicrobiota bacterium]
MKRRTFLSTAGTAAASTVFPRFGIAQSTTSANGKINVAFIGSGGWIARQPYNQGCKDENLVAFCDVDRAVSAENMKNWQTNQPFYEDFRVMLDKMHKEIDAVVVSTPDHTHFAATMACMERGIHVFTQKPLTHNIQQARTLRKAKQTYNVMTQMGNQGHAGDGIRKSVEAYRAGLIGEVSEVYAGNGGPQMGGSHFCNPQSMPPPTSPIPDTLNWDLWLGPQKARPFWSEYLPKKWRAVYDFGGGMLADWGCHTMDTPVWALDLEPPTRVECVQRETSLDGIIPTRSHVKYSFAAKGDRGPVTLHWFDGPQDWQKVG